MAANAALVRNDHLPTRLTATGHVMDPSLLSNQLARQLSMEAAALLDVVKNKEQQEQDFQRAIQASLAESGSVPPEIGSTPEDTAKAESSQHGSKRPRENSDESGAASNADKRRRINIGVDFSGCFKEALSSDNNNNSTEDDDGELSQCVVKPGEISTTFADVHVSEEALEALDVLSLSTYDPGAFKFGILANSPQHGVLLYGPPGTGKTLLVRALANQGHATLLSLTSADIRSKYPGDGEKKIQRIFRYANKHHPCIIFIDEADALFRSRSAESHCRGHLEDINQFLAEMDGIKSSSITSPIVIAATNRPFDIDEGVLRRLGRRIMVDIPDNTARDHIMSILLKDEYIADDADIPDLVNQTQGYTGSDLRALVRTAAISAVREIRDYRRIGRNPPGFSGMLLDGTPPRRILRKAHFLRARQEIRASPNKETVAKIRDFHNKFGNTSERVALDDERPEVINKGKAPI